MGKVERMKIEDAKNIVTCYYSALECFKRTGVIRAPLNNKKQSAIRIINYFKLYHANVRKNRCYGMKFRSWDEIEEILRLLMDNNAAFVEKEIDLDVLKKDYDEFLTILDDIRPDDELYWDRVYVLIGIKKPLLFFLDSV